MAYATYSGFRMRVMLRLPIAVAVLLASIDVTISHAGQRPTPTARARPAAPPAKASANGSSFTDEVRALHALQEAEVARLGRQPLWFKQTDGRIYAAGFDKQTKVFRIEWVDVEGLRADIDAAGPVQRPGDSYQQSAARGEALDAALRAKYASYRFLRESYPVSFIGPNIVRVAEQARDLADLRRSLAAARGADEAAHTSDPSSTLLDVGGLRHARVLQDLYLGRFDRARTTYTSALALEQYIVQASATCPRLPNYEQITKLWTLTETTTKFGVTSSEVVSQVRIDTGIWAAPEFARVHGKVTPHDLVNVFKLVGAVGLLRTPEVLRATAAEIGADVKSVLDRHGCSSPVTRRFADNLLRFIEYAEPVEAYSAARHTRMLSTLTATGAPAGLRPVTLDGMWRVDYGSVPDAFSPTLPADRPRAALIAMDRSRPGALESASIDDFTALLSDGAERASYLDLRRAAVTGWRPGSTHSALDGHADVAFRPILEDLAAGAVDSGYAGVTGPDGFRHHVLTCGYRPGDVRPLQTDDRTGRTRPEPPREPGRTFHFWFRTKPAFATSPYLSGRSSTHPLLMLLEPRELCPVTSAEAMALAPAAAIAASTPAIPSRPRTPNGRSTGGRGRGGAERAPAMGTEAGVEAGARVGAGAGSDSGDGAAPRAGVPIEPRARDVSASPRPPAVYAGADAYMAKAAIIRITDLLDAYSKAIAAHDLDALTLARSELTSDERALVAPTSTAAVRFEEVQVSLTAADAAIAFAHRVVTSSGAAPLADQVEIDLTRRRNGWVIVDMRVAATRK